MPKQQLAGTPVASLAPSCGLALGMFARRSEEHTSELQSHHDLVCRLLLEKKKCNRIHAPHYTTSVDHNAGISVKVTQPTFPMWYLDAPSIIYSHRQLHRPEQSP